MIPYEELVFALQSWRAKQGLPVEAAMVPGSGPATTAPGADPHGAAYEVDDAALIDESSYAADGGDFVSEFGEPGSESGPEATAIGGMPLPETTLDEPEAELEDEHRPDREDW